MDGKLKCTKCHESCVECSGAANNQCTKCDSDKYVSKGKCFSCSENCLTCETSQDNCTSCKTTGTLKILDSTKCVEKCPEKKYQKTY